MSSSWAPKKPNFGKPPPGYIAGLGRGATGFITRSDVGPSKVPEVTNIQTAQVEDANYNQAKFDEWEGFQGALFAKGNLDDEDKQAQDAYDFCEKRVWERRLKQRQILDKKIKDQTKTDNSITSKFIDLKRDLATVTNEEWEAIPECVDLSIKKRKREKFAPVPDALVMNLLSSKEAINTVADDGQNIQDFHDAKEVLLRSKLDNIDNSVTGKSNVDKIGYMTELNSHKLDAQFIGDVKKARILLKSAISSNPKNPDIWLSAARVQELDGKINESRQILRKAIQQCPLCQDIWIQLSRIQKVDQAKDVLIEGLRFLPASEKLWLYAARRQNQDKELKSKILRKGLENIPTSVKLWRELIEMQSVEEAKKLLYKAVQSLPKQIDLWLALAKIQDYKSAQKVLNKARKYNPLSLTIWISAARLEEAQSKVEPIPKIAQKIEAVLSRGRQTLKKNGANISRQQWLEQAFYAEKSESYLVCQMLVKISISYGLTQQQIRNVLVKDVQFYEKQKQSNRTTRFIYRYGIQLTKSKELMKQMIQFQKRKRMKKQYQQLNSTLKFAVKIFESDNLFWKVTISKLIKEANYDAALGLIQAAITKIDKDQEEDIRLMKVKIYMFLQQYQKARSQLQSLRADFPKGSSIFESIKFEYEVDNYEAAWKLCQKYFRESKSEDIWRLAFRVKQKVGTYAESYAIIQKAVASFPQSLPVWLDIIQFEIQNNHISKSRALIDKALQKIPKCQELSILSIQLQRKFGNKKEAAFCLAKALKIFPKSPEIWGIAIELQPQNTQKKKASTAIQVCGQSAYINSSVAKLFWKQDKFEKAKKWFEEALKMSPNNGDIWALYIRLIQQRFSSQQEQVRKRFRQIESQFYGRKWKRVQDDKGGWRLKIEEILEILIKQVDAQIQALNS